MFKVIIISHINHTTSIAHHVSNMRQVTPERFFLTIFHLVILHKISWIFKMDGNFRYDHIAIYNFTANWFHSSFLATIMILVTMIPSIPKIFIHIMRWYFKCHYSRVQIIFEHSKMIFLMFDIFLVTMIPIC